MLLSIFTWISVKHPFSMTYISSMRKIEKKLHIIYSWFISMEEFTTDRDKLVSNRSRVKVNYCGSTI